MTDRPTDRPTDKAGCRVACTRLKMRMVWLRGVLSWLYFDHLSKYILSWYRTVRTFYVYYYSSFADARTRQMVYGQEGSYSRDWVDRLRLSFRGFFRAIPHSLSLSFFGTFQPILYPTPSTSLTPQNSKVTNVFNLVATTPRIPFAFVM